MLGGAKVAATNIKGGGALSNWRAVVSRSQTLAGETRRAGASIKFSVPLQHS